YWLLVTGYWLLVTGYWLLVTGYWLLVTGYWLQNYSLVTAQFILYILGSSIFMRVMQILIEKAWGISVSHQLDPIQLI
ncbi:hypothetical protein, partial [Paenibacillus hunanensis]